MSSNQRTAMSFFLFAIAVVLLMVESSALTCFQCVDRYDHDPCDTLEMHCKFCMAEHTVEFNNRTCFRGDECIERVPRVIDGQEQDGIYCCQTDLCNYSATRPSLTTSVFCLTLFAKLFQKFL